MVITGLPYIFRVEYQRKPVSAKINEDEKKKNKEPCINLNTRIKLNNAQVVRYGLKE